MNTNLPNARATFLLESGRADVLKKLVDPLKDAPLRMRRLGLPLAVATWSREGHDLLVQILSDWLFAEWKMLGPGPCPARRRVLAQPSHGCRSGIDLSAFGSGGRGRGATAGRKDSLKRIERETK